ncbi:phage portal protein [Pararhizobium mangrovi]|uniref:Phage portal protein n=1 Tax=Pararhizobium mangrovi TaxID=2590452 RepID=A0A506TZG9_9HYPH|nr:phage portal protein [Pararhizobium mangrovi]TPW26381.1 phage portal protein [Pararhizobium mangrovi]
MADKAVLSRFTNLFRGSPSTSSTEEVKSAPAAQPNGWPLDLFSAPTISGPSVTSTTALRVPAVLHAVRLISENVGSLPVKVYRHNGDGKDQDKTHPAYRLVHGRANEWTSAGDLRMAMTLDALTTGHGYALVTRYPDGRPFELHRLDPSRVTRLQDEFTGAPIYRLNLSDGGQHDYGFRDVLHVSAFAGVAPITLGREAIGVAMTLEKHAAQFFGSGARPAAVISREKDAGELGETAVRNVMAAYRRASDSGFKTPLLLDQGMSYEQASFASTDAQFLEHRVEQINEISRLFGVPPHLLFNLDRATWSNAEQLFESFVTLALRPWLDRWQDAYATVLLDDEEHDDVFIEFVVDDLARADIAGRTDAFGKLIAARVMTPNEARGAMNLPPRDGGDELANPYTTTTTTRPATPPAKDAA